MGNLIQPVLNRTGTGYLVNNQAFGTWNGTATSAGLVNQFGATPNSARGVNLYRTDWQGRQLLYPTARTNLALWSHQFSNVAWGARWGGTATITDNDATYTAPDGTLTVSKVVATLGGSGIGQAFAVTAGQAYVFIIWCACPSAGVSILAATGSSGSNPVRAALAVPTNSALIKYQLAFTAPFTEPLYIGIVDSVALQTFYCWFGDIKASSVSSSQIPTTTAPVTLTDYTLSGTTVNLAQAPGATATTNATFYAT